MSVGTTSAYSSATGNGSNKNFPFTFRAETSAEVAVYAAGVLQASGYTVTLTTDGLGNPIGGGTVVFTAAPANGAKVVVASSPLFTQTISFENSGSFLPATHDDVNDRAAIRDIYLKALLDRAILVPWGETGGVLADAATRANQFVKFDASGNPTIGSAAGAVGPAPTLSIGTVTGLAAGATPTVSLTGGGGTYAINYGIPAGATGATGAAPTLTFGAVTTGAAGTSASVNVTNLGGGAYQLDFTIPRGATGASGALSDGTFGDIVVSGTGTLLTVGNDKITYAKMQNVSATNRILGRITAGAGDPEELTAANVKTILSLTNVDNTSDANKPVSTAQQTALNLKADLNSPTFTNTPAAPTAAIDTSTTQLATTAFVDRFRDIPVRAKTAAYTLALTDRGYTISTNSTVHVPPNSSVAFPVGSFVEIYNASNSPITVDFSSGTDAFRKEGSTSTVTTLTLAARSFGQIRKPDIATEWTATGFS